MAEWRETGAAGAQASDGPGSPCAGDYGTGDLEVLLRRGSWQDWDTVIRWLDDNGSADPELPADRAAAMKEDFEELRKERVPFAADPQRLYDLTHEERRRRG